MLAFIDKNKLFEGKLEYIRTVIKGCLEQEEKRFTIDELWYLLREGIKEEGLGEK